MGERRGNLELKGDTLFITAVARKKGKREAPLELWLDFPYVDLIVEQWEGTSKGERVWPISEWASWNIMKKLDARKYLHFFRFNRLTEMCARARRDAEDRRDLTRQKKQRKVVYSL